MKIDNVLILPDGRKLAYAEFGKPDGHPVLYCHGCPTSRLEPLLLGDNVFSQLGLRVICPDRPGIGQSDFQSRRGFSDWPTDVNFLMEAIGLDRFSVLGVSGGGGYAAVCAAKIPEKLCKVVIASGAWRMDWPEAVKNATFPYNLLWRSAKHAPILLSFILNMLNMLLRPPKGDYEQVLAQQKETLPASKIFLWVVGEAVTQGSKGPLWDMRLYVREWDFDPAEIHIPLVLFHAERDKNIPLALVQRVANSLPRAQLLIYPGGDHFLTPINHFDEIAQALMPG
jgi:pimeloyl-ACP methyl ester carboxylesterase